MRGVPFFLNRYVGPFLTGGLVAAAASAGGPVPAAFLVVLAAGTGFLSLPGGARLIGRVLGGAA